MTSFLIVRLGSLGDVIHAIPAAAALRAAFAGARIDWLVDPRYVELLNLVEGIDRRIPVDTRGSNAALAGTLRECRRIGYDATFDFQGLVKSAALARFAGARKTFGFTRAHLREPAARFLYTDTVDPGDVRHVIHKNLRLVQAIGADVSRVSFPITLPRTAAVDVTSRAGEYALINPGAAWPNKRWPAARFGALAARLFEEHGIASIVLWGPGEESLGKEVVAAAAGSATLSPPTSIVDLFGLARGSRLMVSGDTGPLHIAAAVGTPVVALFGPTDPARNGPWDPRDEVVSRMAHCICHYRRTCRRSAQCIEDISVEEVTAAARRRLVTVS